MGKVIYPELSYKLVGLMYEVYNELGYGYQERYYQRAIEKYFQESKIKYKKELYCPIKVKDKNIGSYRLDFLVDDKIVLELKVANQVYIKHIKQVLGYLKQNNLKLGILSIFTKDGVKIQRILN